MALPLLALREAMRDQPSVTAAPTAVVVLPERTAPVAAATGETREEQKTGWWVWGPWWYSPWWWVVWARRRRRRV